jgi:hypothetical protein
MNTKRRLKTDWQSPYLHEVAVTSGSKTYSVLKGMLLSVRRRPGLYAGQYEFLYGELVGSTLLLTVEGPVSRTVDKRYRKTIRETDVKTVHIKTGAR